MGCGAAKKVAPEWCPVVSSSAPTVEDFEPGRLFFLCVFLLVCFVCLLVFVFFLAVFYLKNSVVLFWLLFPFFLLGG